MRRRTFCGAALAGATLAALPIERLFAAGVGTGQASAEIPAIGRAGKQIVLSSADVADFHRSLRGSLLLPGNDGYETARKVWNGAFDRKPALIARCAGAADVVQAVTFGREHDLLVSVRGGGHSLSGQSVCEGGLMIDLSPMKGIRIDPAAMTARVEPGVLLGDFDREAQAFGLATTAGTISHTGVAGLTLGGGFGRIGRIYGLACDNLQAADVVPASARLVYANSTENADLLWGLRGGGGNFGVVASFEYRLHRVEPNMLGGDLIYSLQDAQAVLNFYSQFADAAPDDLFMIPHIVPTPNGVLLVIDVTYAGAPSQGERAIEPMRKIRKPLRDTVVPSTYVDLQRRNDAKTPHGRRYYTKAGFIRRLEPALIEQLVDRMHPDRKPLGAINMPQGGGAIGRVSPTATAFAHREAAHSVIAQSSWNDRNESDARMQWARETWRLIEPFTRGFYVNDLAADDTQQRVRENYAGNLERLVDLKTQYDPTNLFKMNANVEPRAGKA